jgi:hypothetical protein
MVFIVETICIYKFRGTYASLKYLMIRILLKKTISKQLTGKCFITFRHYDIGTYIIFTKFVGLPEWYISEITEEISIKYDTGSPSH